MLMLVSYDVSTVDRAGRSRLRRIAKACLNWGIRVQNSVFECNVNPAEWVQLKAQLEDIFDPKTDSLRYYNLGDNYNRRIEHVGAKPALDVEQPLLL
ncbi:MAG: CRISPR-associated endonuclease Cas2 [Kiritimatiellae bacterium]|nr:CRISPR-associated endonuclease Cas2 [Kiritimatiellia bacterium]